jgi:hypothetical protein
MHAFVQAVETLIVALAAIAFAHFGISMKQPPHPGTEQAVRPASMAAASQAPTTRAHGHCPYAKDMQRT